MTIRSWFVRRRSPPNPRNHLHAPKAGVVTAEPPRRDDLMTNSMAEPSNGRATEPSGQTILVAVRNAAEESRGQGSLTDDVGQAEAIATSLVESGVKRELLSAMQATEVPLTVAYKWTVEIGDKDLPRPRTRTAVAPTAPAASPSVPTASPSVPAAPPVAREGSALNRANEILQDILPEAPFQLRFDRVVWMGLWAASLLILGILLVASLSGGSAREFVIGGQPSPFGSESSVSNVTARPTPLPTASPAVSAAAPLPSCLQGTVNNCQCQDFATQGEAQKFFTAHPPPVRQPVDPDGDGLVCEWLPKITASPRQ